MLSIKHHDLCILVRLQVLGFKLSVLSALHRFYLSVCKTRSVISQNRIRKQILQFNFSCVLKQKLDICFGKDSDMFQKVTGAQV